MATLFGQSLARRDLLARLGNPGAAAGVRLCQFADGPERGVRFLDFRTGTGLAFTVIVDRGMDIGELHWRGIPLGWQSPTGFRAPWLTDAESEGGTGIHRSFSGFWVTCGFDHVRRAEEGSAAHFNVPTRPTMSFPLHGRGAMLPARLCGYGADWQDGDLLLWAEGEVRQVALLGENISLRRRMALRAGRPEITITDRITNDGFIATPHMLLYHINVGWPLLDEGARLRAPIRDTVWANLAREQQRFGFITQPAPLADGVAQVSVHRVIANSAGRVPLAVLNDRLALGLVVEYDARLLPWLQLWQNPAEGVYALGLEPTTNRFASRAELDTAGELRRLLPGEAVEYVTTMRIADGAAELAEIGASIDAVHRQPTDEFPPRTGATEP